MKYFFCEAGKLFSFGFLKGYNLPALITRQVSLLNYITGFVKNRTDGDVNMKRDFMLATPL